MSKESCVISFWCLTTEKLLGWCENLKLNPAPPEVSDVAVKLA